jgi:hypothetical protein
MLPKVTAELERSATIDEQIGFNARDVLNGTVDDMTVRQAVFAGRADQ